MARKYKYHRENCDCLVRRTIIDIYDRTIILGGQHAFEWYITIVTKDRIIRYEYPCGEVARKEFRKYKKKY